MSTGNAEHNQLTLLDCKGIAMGCFVLGRCLQLGQVVTKNDQKAQEYFIKVHCTCIYRQTDTDS